MTATAVVPADILALAADEAMPLAVLRLAAADVESQWLMAELRAQIKARRFGDVINIDSPLGCARYIQLRNDVEKWIEAAAGLRDDLNRREADGEVLDSLWWLLHGVAYCRACMVDANAIADLRPHGQCDRHPLGAVA